MPYVSKDDIMLYIDSQITLQQGVATNVNLILYKDYINNQLNAADADAITVTLYNSKGQRTFQYSDPVVAGQTNRLVVGQPASATQGNISFDISANQAESLVDGDIFVQVTITYSNYYPSAKTYVLPLLQVGYKNQPGTPSETTQSSSTSGTNGLNLDNNSGLTPYVAYNVSHIDGSNPDVKSVSFNSPDPSQVTEIIFYNLDLNNHRNVYLENFLENRIANGVDGTITIVDADNASDYSVYKISSYTRINAESGGGDDNDNDYTKVLVSYEDNSYSPIETPHILAVGNTISYTLDAFGGAGSTPISQQPGSDGTSGTSGTSGINGNPGRDGVDGTVGAQGPAGLNGADGSSGTSGINGIDGANGSSGTSGTNGADGVDGQDGSSGSSGTSGANGADGQDGSSGTSGTNGADGVDGQDGSSGTSGADGLQGPPGMGITFKGSVTTFTALPTADLVIGDAYIADDTDHLYVWNGSEWADGGSIQGPAGSAGTSGSSGTSGANGTSGSSGSSGTSGVSGTSGSSGTSGISGTSGSSGTSGAQGLQGPAGDSGTSGSSGTSGAQGLQGPAGEQGPTGPEGSQGPAGTSGTSGISGSAGIGVPSGGTSGQVLTKVDANAYNTVWADPTGASGAGYTKYLLRLNYDSSESLIAGNSSHAFQAKAGYSTNGAAVSSVVGGSLGSVTVSFTESNPPISIMVMAWDPATNTYKVHHYDKDAANVVINTSDANFTAIGNDQYEPNFFSSFTVGVTIDTRQDYMKFGNNVQSGGFPNPVVNKNPHAYVIFVF